MGFEISNTKTGLVNFRDSEVISNIALEKGMSLKEVKNNLVLREKVINLLSKSDSLSDLNVYSKVKDYYYSLFNERVLNSKKVDYIDIFNKISCFVKKC